ncbi:hypothetical protein GQ457_01G038620 [Hibiscus cannabinus]
MELDLRVRRSSLGDGGGCNPQRETEGSDFPPRFNQAQFLQVQPSPRGRRFSPDRPRQQPQHRAHQIRFDLYVDFLRRHVARGGSGESRIAAAAILPSAEAADSARREGAGSPRREVLR